MKHFNIIPDSFYENDSFDLTNVNLDFNSYFLVIAFRRNEYCLLSTLQVRPNSSLPWHIVASNVGSYSGEITIDLGSFNSGSKLELFWVINAPIIKLGAVAIFIVNKQTKRAFKVAPETGAKLVEKGANWLDSNENILLNF